MKVKRWRNKTSEKEVWAKIVWEAKALHELQSQREISIILCHVMSCHVMSCHIILYYIILYYIILYFVTYDDDTVSLISNPSIRSVLFIIKLTKFVIETSYGTQLHNYTATRTRTHVGSSMLTHVLICIRAAL
jgi:hypothetical protein